VWVHFIIDNRNSRVIIVQYKHWQCRLHWFRYKSMTWMTCPVANILLIARLQGSLPCHGNAIVLIMAFNMTPLTASWSINHAWFTHTVPHASACKPCAYMRMPLVYQYTNMQVHNAIHIHTCMHARAHNKEFEYVHFHFTIACPAAERYARAKDRM